MFAGLLSIGEPVSAWGDPGRIAAALAPYSLDAPRDVHIGEHQLLVQVETRTGAESAAIYQHPESGVAAAFWGRLDNRPELVAALEADIRATDAELVARSWLQWGDRCPERLVGDFAFAIASPRAGTVFLARDIMGVKPLVYRADEHGVFFANSVAAFKPLRLGSLTRSQAWMARFLVYRSGSHTETAFEEVKKLPRAHCVLIHPDGRMAVRKYHAFIDDPPWQSTRHPDWLEAYRASWQEAVACRLPGLGDVGCENSGGIDSGGITAEVARQLGPDIGRLACFGVARQEKEPAMIMATAMKYGISRTLLTSMPYGYGYQPAVLSRSLAVNGYPVEYEVADTHLPFYEQCADWRIGTLYSGFGGDELITSESNAVFSEMRDALGLRDLYSLAPGPAIRKIYRTAKHRLDGYRIHKVARSSISFFQQEWQYTFFNEDAEAVAGLEEEYLHANDFDMEYRTLNSAGLFEIGKPNVSGRTENCTLLAASFGIDYVWPLLDARLMQQWLSTPSIWKLGDGWIKRYLHKCAIAGVCPDEVTWARGKDMGFGPVYMYYDQASNKPYFEQLLAQADRIPAPLQPIIDVPKMRRIAEAGIKEDVRGFATFSAMDALTKRLGSVMHWCEGE